ncbi:hypothetical protein MPSI1_003515 [Malassezia psittaci]|uniref:RNA polymerase I-specific transcription initiation factor rrn11 n=1 Tax=Malassezia psittaci TaxID=1821823 RepID=A0AAF0FDM8_9BASI|nr:hypothetical protein MPSI1_003515 [Malassezia psittaci]
MEQALFQPPPAYMDSHDIVYSHGLASTSYLTPYSSPPDPRAVNLRAWLNQRRRHVRRLYDLLQLQLLHNDHKRAARCLRLLLRSTEWRPIELWTMGLEVVGMAHNKSEYCTRYLQQLSRARPVLRPYLFPHLIREWIATERYDEAVEELNSVITSFPYRHNPQLHAYLGLLTLFMGTSDSRGKASEASDLDSVLVPCAVASCVSTSVRTTARTHFENAIKVAEKYTRVQDHALQHRLLMHQKRQIRTAKLAEAHKERMWRSLRDDGWMFFDSSAYQMHSPTDSSNKQGTDLAAEDSTGEFTDKQFPSASYFALDSSGDSDSNEDSASSSGEIYEGPERGPISSRSTSPVVEEEVHQDSTPSSVISDSISSAHLSIPGVQWAEHVSKIYLDLLTTSQSTLPTRRSWRTDHSTS